MKRPLLLLALALVSLSAHAELRKWVNADGKVVYSDSRPGEDFQPARVRNISGKDSGESSTPQAPKSYAEREAEMKKAKLEKGEQAKKQAQEEARNEARKQNCQAARETVRTLESGARIVVNDENGETAFVDDAGREQRLAAARKAVSDNCD